MHTSAQHAVGTERISPLAGPELGLDTERRSCERATHEPVAMTPVRTSDWLRTAIASHRCLPRARCGQPSPRAGQVCIEADLSLRPLAVPHRIAGMGTADGARTGLAGQVTRKNKMHAQRVSEAAGQNGAAP